MRMIKRKILENVRGQLVLQMEYLRGAAGRTVIQLKDETGNFADVMDQAAAEHDRAVELTIRGRESRQIREIQETIQRIDRGEFGICLRCGKEISPRRLLLAPMSRLCALCKAKTELHSQHGGGYIPGYGFSENHAT